MKLAQAAHILSSNRFASSESGSPRIQDKDQTRAEQQAKDPKMMANLGEEKNKKRDDPHLTSGDLSTPVVKGKSRRDDRIGRNINNKTSGWVLVRCCPLPLQYEEIHPRASPIMSLGTLPSRQLVSDEFESGVEETVSQYTTGLRYYFSNNLI